MSRLLRPVAGASNPEFLRPTLRVVKLRPHVMNLVVETDTLVDGQRQRPKSLQKEAFDSFDNMLLPTSRIMRAAREKKHANVATTPCPSSQSTVPMFALASEARWASLSPQVPHASSKPSLLWPPRSVPQSCRLIGSRTQHLHRLQVPPSRVDCRNPFHWEVSCLCLWTQVSRQQYLVSCTNKYLCPTLEAKQSMFLICPLLSMAPMSLTPNRVSISALQSHLPPL